MAVSAVSICNMALAMLGNDGTTITSLSDTSKAGRLCNLFYEPIRDAVLRAHPWNFAIKRQSLAADATAPAFEYAYAYALPGDFLKMIRTDLEAEGYEDDYRIEGPVGASTRTLLSDQGTVEIEYIYKVTDPNAFDPLFVQALAARLAVALAPGMTDDTAMVTTASNLYKAAIAEARSVDGQEGTPRGLEADTWTNARQ